MKKSWIVKIILYGIGISLLIQLNGCVTLPSREDGAPNINLDVAKISNATPRVEAHSKYGNPAYYYVNGKRQYVLKSSKGYSKVGFASWYGTKFNGHLTSSREPYSLYSMTAASRDLPIPTYVQVTNLETGKSIIVKVNDRGPFVANRIIDLSYVAAKKLGYANKGTALVRVTAIDPHLWALQHQQQPHYENNLPSQYYMQVGAFASKDNAENYSQRIASLTNAPIDVQQAVHNNNVIYRVQVGPLAAIESNELREKLESQGLAPGINVIG